MSSRKAGQPNAAVRLEAVNRQLRRWQTRATRANNMVAKLLKTQRRIMVEFDYGPVAKAEAAPSPVLPKEVVAPPKTLASPATVEVVPLPKAGDPGPKLLAELLPAFLDRSDPHIAAKMTATRKKAEAEARKQMPLTGRDAERMLRREIGKAKKKA